MQPFLSKWRQLWRRVPVDASGVPNFDPLVQIEKPSENPNADSNDGPKITAIRELCPLLVEAENPPEPQKSRSGFVLVDAPAAIVSSEDSYLTYELNAFAELPRCFMVAELGDFADAYIGRDLPRDALVCDARFLQVSQDGGPEDFFVSRSTLFRWFDQLTFRLAWAKKSRLTRSQLANLMSSLRLEGRWREPPEQVVQFGLEHHFFETAWTAGEFVFPLAHLMSFASPLVIKSTAPVALEIREGRGGHLENALILEATLNQGLAWFESKGGWVGRSGKKIVHVVLAREGLSHGERLTLEQIGDSLGLTRERVRQLEAKFWERIRMPSAQVNLTKPFLLALIESVSRRQGSLIYRLNPRDGRLLRFMAKCVGVPTAQIIGTDLVILGASQSLDLKEWLKSKLPDDYAEIGTYLDENIHPCLAAQDVKEIAEELEHFLQPRLTKARMVYLALRDIGRPAHYSEVAHVCNSMFPERPMTENNVLAILGRNEASIVWVGLRGTYALKELGYERPSNTLFDTVANIVLDRYNETNSPVPFAVILAEIGKYRPLVKVSSLTIAAYCNPCLQRVGIYSFAPKVTCDGDGGDLSPVELDRILSEFDLNKCEATAEPGGQPKGDNI